MSKKPIDDLLRGTRSIAAFVPDPDGLFGDCTQGFSWDKSIPDRPFARFGVPYGDDEDPQVIPFHEALEPLLNGIQEQFSFRPNSCSCHWYLRGDSFMGFHSDNVEDIGEGTGVIIVSLGGERILRFKQKDDPAVTHDFCLASGDLLFMNSELQETWTHGVPKQAGSDQRISQVFRCIPY